MPELEQLELEHISHKLLTLYKASHLQQLLSRPAAEILAKRPLLEVRTERPVILPGDGDKPPHKHMRIALPASRRPRLHKGVMLFRITRQHPLVILAHPRPAVTPQERLHIDTQVGVRVKALLHI